MINNTIIIQKINIIISKNVAIKPTKTHQIDLLFKLHFTIPVIHNNRSTDT